MDFLGKFFNNEAEAYSKPITKSKESDLLRWLMTQYPSASFELVKMPLISNSGQYLLKNWVKNQGDLLVPDATVAEVEVKKTIMEITTNSEKVGYLAWAAPNGRKYDPYTIIAVLCDQPIILNDWAPHQFSKSN